MKVGDATIEVRSRKKFDWQGLFATAAIYLVVVAALAFDQWQYDQTTSAQEYDNHDQSSN